MAVQFSVSMQLSAMQSSVSAQLPVLLGPLHPLQHKNPVTAHERDSTLLEFYTQRCMLRSA